MEIFLIRHAQAVARSPESDDAARPLSPSGRKRFVRAVRGLKRLGIRFDRLYHSPWLRALETAEALVPLVKGEFVVSPWLAEAPQPSFFQELSGRRVAVVGHEPWLSELLAWLVVGTPEPGSKFVLKKGSVAWLQGEPRSQGMAIQALLTPKVLRAIAPTK